MPSSVASPPSDSARNSSGRAKPSARPVAAAPQRPDWIKRGAVVLDAATGRVGEVQHVGPPYPTGRVTVRDRDKVWLRPCGGGQEWDSTVAELSLAAPGSQGAP